MSGVVERHLKMLASNIQHCDTISGDSVEAFDVDH
jgi:hypothetical protein